MLLTAKCIAIAFLAGYVTGVPLVWLARRGNALSATDWLYAPFIGLGAISLLTHQLVYLDVRIAWSTPAIWCAAGVLWLVLGLRRGWATPFVNCPWPALLATLGVYLVHSLGVVLNGTDQYVGRNHTDRFNYICVAQYLIDVPFSADWQGIGQRAYLADGVKLKMDRIGVMALQGFLAVSSGVTADRTFASTLLLGPALVVPALLLVCRLLRLGSRESLLAATAGGLLPALTTLHTLCFLANVVAIPFFLASVAAVCALVSAPTIRRTLLAGFLFAATACLYTEFTPALGAVAAGAVVFRLLLDRRGARRAGLAVLATGVVALAIYPKTFEAKQWRAVTRTTEVTGKQNPVSWVQGVQMPGAVWVYDVWSVEPPTSRRRIVTGIGFVLTALGALGFLRLVWGAATSWGRAEGPQGAGSGVMALVLVCLAVGPFVFFADGKHNYQAMKLLFSLAPLWVVGVAGALRAPGEFSPQRWALWRRGGLIALGGTVAITGYGTAALVHKLTTTQPAPRSFHLTALDPNFNALKAALRKTRGQNVVLGVGGGMLGNGELSLAARRNRVWLACPQVNDRHALGCYHPDPPLRTLREEQAGCGRHLVDLTAVPAEALVVTLNTPAAPLLVEGDKRLVREFGPYQMWRVGPGPYRFITTEHAMRPPELDHPSPKK